MAVKVLINENQCTDNKSLFVFLNDLKKIIRCHQSLKWVFMVRDRCYISEEIYESKTMNHLRYQLRKQFLLKSYTNKQLFKFNNNSSSIGCFIDSAANSWRQVKQNTNVKVIATSGRIIGNALLVSAFYKLNEFELLKSQKFFIIIDSFYLWIRISIQNILQLPQ